MEISQREVNFPKIVKDSIQYSFPLKNVGNKKLLINAVNVSCGCTSVEYTKQPINYIFIVYAEFDNESRVAGYDLLSNPATFFWGQS